MKEAKNAWDNFWWKRACGNVMIIDCMRWFNDWRERTLALTKHEMKEWSYERTNKWTNEQKNAQTNDRTNDRSIKRMNEWTNEWMTGWLNEWISEWMNEWMNESINGFIRQLDMRHFVQERCAHALRSRGQLRKRHMFSNGWRAERLRGGEPVCAIKQIYKKLKRWWPVWFASAHGGCTECTICKRTTLQVWADYEGNACARAIVTQCKPNQNIAPKNA